MRLAAVGIGMLIMLSGSVTGGLAGHRAESSPTVTLKTSTPSPSSSGQPTPPSTSEPRRTSVTAVMNGTAAGRHEAGHCVGGRGDLPRGSAPREVARAVPKLSAFAVPPHVVRAIAATGYDMCTTASNHAVDQGFAVWGAPSMSLIGPKSRTSVRLAARSKRSDRRSSQPGKASRSQSSRPPSA
jgi:hypothetical protein